jgi:hypothetical protein
MKAREPLFAFSFLQRSTMREFLPMVQVRRSVPQWTMLASMALSSTGCFFHKQVRVFAPPPTPPPQTAAAKPAPPPVLATQPELEATLEAPVLPAPIFPDLPPPPRPTPPPVKRPPVASTPKPPAPTTPESPAPPKLGQIFTAEQSRELNRTLDDSLERVKRNLETAGKRTLTAEQADTVAQIRTFQKQAEQAREQDLVTAVSLARRADLLAKDLIERLP